MSNTVSAACFAELGHDVICVDIDESKISFKELPVDDTKQRRPDITKAREFLRWEPRFSLERGLKETIKHFKDMLGVIK